MSKKSKKNEFKKTKGDDEKQRLAVIKADKCKPKKCSLECKKSCPINKTGRMCIEVSKTSTICEIGENLCIGCGICIKKCPYDAIEIINLPKSLDHDTIHRYGKNSFKLHRLPVPRCGEVLGLVGTNGIGKSTALKILANKLKPNLGRYEDGVEWTDILKYHAGSELQNYFKKLLKDDIKCGVKVQSIDAITKNPKTKGLTIKDILEKRDERDMYDKVVDVLDLEGIIDREVQHLSGGELQRFVVALTCIQDKQIYMFDEPSSYLDVKQRLNAADLIRSLSTSENYVLVVEHDLSILDYMSDYTCVLYGTPSLYGVVTAPFSVREGINVFLQGFIPTENMKFRDTELSFKVSTDAGQQTALMEEEEKAKQEEKEKAKKKKKKGKDDEEEEEEKVNLLGGMNQYPAMSITLGGFKLNVDEGVFHDSEIVVMLGENGTGKSTLISLLAGVQKPDDEKLKLPDLNISVKPQKINPKFKGTVRELLDAKLKMAWQTPIFKTEVTKPMKLDAIIDNKVQTLSGGELQRVAIILALGKPCDLYLIDEPSAHLDSEQRIIASKVMKRWIYNQKKPAFIVEHDFIMASYLADKVIVFQGKPGVETRCNAPLPLVKGMNMFLEMLNITFRRDPTNFRPRINKLNSQKDQEQKASGDYFLTDESKLDGIKKAFLAKKAEAKKAKEDAKKKNGKNEEVKEEVDEEEEEEKVDTKPEPKQNKKSKRQKKQEKEEAAEAAAAALEKEEGEDSEDLSDGMQ